MNSTTTYRIYADGTVVHQDDFQERDSNPQVYDDYNEVSVPDLIVEYIEAIVTGK